MVVLLLTQVAKAQDQCIADAGSLSLPQSTFCVGDTIRILATGQTTGLETRFLLTDSLNTILDIDNQTGVFPDLDLGTYQVFAFTFDPDSPPSVPPAVGSSINQIQDRISDCFDLSSAIRFRVVNQAEPAAICLADTIQLFLDADGGIDLSPWDLYNSQAQPGCAIPDSLYLTQSVFTCIDLGYQNVGLIVVVAGSPVDTCFTTLYIQDTTGPVAECLPTLDVFLDGNGTWTYAADQLDIASTDNCALDSLWTDPERLSCDALGADNSVKLIARDRTGRTDTCMTQVTVKDTIAPIALCKTDEVRHLDEDGEVRLFLDSASYDNCLSGLTMWQSQDILTCADLGTTDYSLFVEDASGNRDTCQTTVALLDTIRPVAECADQTIFLNNVGSVTVTANSLNGGSTDNCGLHALSINRAVFGCGDVGEKSVNLTVTDQAGNTDQCTATITIRDTVAPIALCRSATLYLDDQGQVTLQPEVVDNNSRDNCGQVANLLLNQYVFDCTDVGSQLVTLSATDPSGNVSTCTSTVSIIDTLQPAPVCADPVIYLNNRGVATLPVASVWPVRLDHCGDTLAVSLDQNRFTCSDLGTQTVQLTALDKRGNEGNCTASVTIRDTIAPEPACAPDTVFLDVFGTAAVAVDDLDAGTSDNCGLPTQRTLDKNTFTCADVGEEAVRITYVDAAGNSRSCTTTVTVMDTITPQIGCRDFTLELGINGQATLTADLINNQTTDNCGAPLMYELSRTAFSCDDLGPNQVELSAVDVSGNNASCTATVTVIDSKKPQVLTRNLEVYLDENGHASVDPVALDAGSTDNCSIIQYELDQSVFSCADVGPNLVSLTVMDVDSNRSTKTAVITVRDTLSPRLTCPDERVVLTGQDANFSCDFLVVDRSFDPSNVSDNCGIVSLRHDFAPAPADSTLLGAALPTGVTRITWEVTDENGQLSTCSTQITVEDDEAPLADCRDSVLIRLATDGSLELDPVKVDMGSTDNCGITDFSFDRNSFSCSDVGFHDITLTMGDAAGNQSSCQVVVGIMASSACPQPVFRNSDGPDISDPCSCRDDGSFDEQVVIGPAAPNQVWTVKTTTLLNPATLQPYAVGTMLQEVPQDDGESIYVLDGVHQDGVGYTLTAESPLYQYDLSISNTCYYPQPEIIGLDGPVCLFTNPIPLEGTGGVGVQGNGSFTINGQPAVIFDPSDLGTGTHLVTFTFDAGDPSTEFDPGNVACSASISREVTVIETPEEFACNDMVTITVNAGCEILVRPEMVMSGNYLCYDDYEIFISYDGQVVPNPVPAQFTGLTLRTLVRHRPSGRICIGNVRLVDVQGPQVDSCATDIRDRFICSDVSTILNNPETIDPDHPLYTGRPSVEDNCSGTTLTFQDLLVDQGACDGDDTTAYIRRRFFAEDKFGNESTCDQLIYFLRPSEVFIPADTVVRLDCTQDPLAVDEDGNIAPSVSGRPYYLNGYGEEVPVMNNGGNCGYAAIYDDTRINICNGQYTLLREWRIFDYCRNETVQEVTQLIEVGDFDDPLVSCPEVDFNQDGLPDAQIRYSTDPDDCTATLTIPAPRIEDCSSVTVETRIYSNVPETIFGFPTGDTLFQELNGVTISNGVASEVPVGEHFFLFTVRDNCGNTTRDTCSFLVEDGVTPTTFCDDQITVTLGNSGDGQVLPGDIDEGSRDNCDDQDLDYALRRLVSADCSETDEAYYTDWSSLVTVNCCDVGGLVTAELRVTDQSGNSNTCVSRIRVEDKTRPQCTAPADLTIDCNDLPVGFDPSDREGLQQLFGEPQVTDNCQEGARWEELTPVSDLDQCGYGTITRTFRALDASGNTSAGTCSQLITVREVHHYSITFPADVSTSCGEPEVPGVRFEEIACDLIAVQVRNDTFSAATEGCYKVHRSYQVINWCEYDGISSPITLPRNADCDGTPGDEDLWVQVEENGNVYFDRDGDFTNAVPAAGTKSRNCDGLTNPEGYWISTEQFSNLRSRGFWRYVQHITVYDDTDPLVQVASPEPFCTTDKTNCTGPVSVPFEVLETCTAPRDVTIEVFWDDRADGSYDSLLPPTALRGSYPVYRVEGTFALGDHAFLLEVTDGCGNQVQRRVAFTVEDCQATAPICRSGLVVELGALEGDTDVDGDGQLDLAAAKIAAVDLAGSAVSDCSGPVQFSLNRTGNAASIDMDSLWVTCADEGTVQLELQAWDAAGNRAFCNTFIEVQNNGDVCTPIPEGAVMGQVMTETGMGIPSVLIRLSGNASTTVQTDGRGEYRIGELEEGEDYSLTPLLDTDPKNGVTTYDLILIRRHILNYSNLDSPYKLIAADVNNSGTITVLDMVQLQRMVLGYSAGFENNTSWRFVESAYTFPNPADPWAEGFPEVVNINNLVGQRTDADFVAVKVGDVNHTLRLPGVGESPIRSLRPELPFRLSDRSFAAGDYLEIPFYLPGEMPVEGYQFTLAYDRNLLEVEDVVHGLAGPEQFGFFAEAGLITTHWYRTESVDEQQPLFTLRVRSKAEGALSEALRLNSRITRAEAYEPDGSLLQPVLQFEQGSSAPTFALRQNQPNPFREGTVIQVVVPEEVRGQLQVFDAKGQLLQQRTDHYRAGPNDIRIPRGHLPAGVLYYRFVSPTHQATRKMILLE